MTTHDSRTTPADRAIVEAAARAMAEHGLDIPLPWEGDLDDAERERFEALCASLAAALPLVAEIADRLTDDETRKALGGNAVIAAHNIGEAIRALAARLAEAGNE